MAVLRERMDDEFDEVIENAQILGDWKFYVRKYPWLCLAGAAVVGYAVVPKRGTGLPGSESAGNGQAGTLKLPAPLPVSLKSSAPGRTVKSMLLKMLMRTAVTYAGRKLGEVLTQGLHENRSRGKF
jgi:hypothetical protein